MYIIIVTDACRISHKDLLKGVEDLEKKMDEFEKEFKEESLDDQLKPQVDNFLEVPLNMQYVHITYTIKVRHHFVSAITPIYLVCWRG